MAVTVEQFLERLSQSGLMSAAEVSAFQDSLPPDKRPKDAETLARELVRANKLTKYQAQAVYGGKVKGLVFGQYVVLDKLGEGGMGVVLKAQHRRMKRTVAIKVLSSAAVKQAGSVERFHREVEAAAKLIHPNIATAFDADEYLGMHYLAMEYIEGRDLAAIVKEHGPLGVREAVEYILQAARGLQYAHGKGIVHRDIKPGNLLLDKEGTVKILDMGLALIAGADAALGGPERLTATGQVMGTCDYMAPEQSLDTRQADARADIYSLGCTLFRLLTGNPPYRGETVAKLFLMHLESPIPSLCEARPEVPAELDACFQRMMAKEPGDRQQSMAEVVTELEAVLAVLSGHSATAAADEPSSAVVARTLAFLQEATPRGTLTKQKKSTADQRTQPHISPEHGTGTNILGKVKRAVGMARRKPLLLLGIGGGLVVLLVVVLALTLRQGTLVVEIDEQLGKDVKVAVGQGGEKVQVADARSGWTLSLSTGKYDLAVEGGDDQFQLDSESVTVTRGGQVKVKVTLKPPLLAVAPFDEKKAKERQEAWARYLGVPVEFTSSFGMEFVLVPPGEFMMGSDDSERLAIGSFASEKPIHKVRISKPFYLGKYIVTVAQFRRFVEATGHRTEAEILGKGWTVKGTEWDAQSGINWRNPGFKQDESHPAVVVSWDDAQKFCEWATRMSGRTVRLPTEAEWEYAARGPMGLKYPWGNQWDGTLANHADQTLKSTGLHLWSRELDWSPATDGYAYTSPVGVFRNASWCGAFDMAGNIWEWCQDWASDTYYAQSPPIDPPGPTSGTQRVCRGGPWNDPGASLRSACRLRSCYPYCLAANDGFRAIMEVPRVTKGLPTHASESTDRKAASGTQPSPSIGADGKWQLPPGAPRLAVAPFDAQKAKEHQAAWAKHLGVPVEMTNSIGMKLVLIPPGEFEMGSSKELIEEELKAHSADQWYKEHLPGEHPQHRVRITRPFYLGTYLVTQGEYQRVMGVNPSEFSATGKGKDKVAGQDTKRFPVECVSWDDAVEFCRKLSEMPEEKAAGRTYLLPSEAQWEYACRAGSTGPYSFSLGGNAIPKESDENALSDCGWFGGNSGGMSHAVGGKRASAWGLYDMHGNVWEWCQDLYDKDYYASLPTDDPSGPPGGSPRVNRGGAWSHPAEFCRSAGRYPGEPGYRDHSLGFRVSQVLADKPGEPTAPPVAAIRADSESKIGDLRSEIPALPPAAAPVAVSSPQQPPPPKSEAPPISTALKQKLPVPDDAAQTQARKTADALFKTEIEKAKTSADKVTLAKRLLAQALGQTGDTASQYVLMLGAKDLAATARDAETAFQVIDQMAGVFDVDRFAMKTDILTGWAKESRAPEARKWVVEQMLAIGDEAVDAGNLEAAKELGTLATSKSGGLRDKNLTLKLKAYRQRFIEAGKEIEELQEARAALARDSKDPKASLVLGQYLCFSKGDWQQGLTLLAQGSDALLQGLAHRELTSPPQQPDEQVKLGDAWWEIASTRGRSQTSAIKIHAGRWYRQADAALPASPVKYNVEKRLAEVKQLRSHLPLPPPAIAPFGEKRAKEHQQQWATYLGEPVEMTNSIGMKLVLIPPGEFIMGSPKELIEEELKAAGRGMYRDRLPAEGPQHRVRITKPFYLGTYLVTQGEYQRVMGVNPSEFSATGKRKDKVAGQETKRFPVENVSWDDAVEFCRKLSEMPDEKAAGRWYRLPSEAQWEYACRAGSTGRYSFSFGGIGISKESEEQKLFDYGWCAKNSGGVIHALGLKRASAWGLYDMHGNVWEWCQDWFDDKGYYAKSPTDDPAGPPEGGYRVVRGGSWNSGAGDCRSALRYVVSEDRLDQLGFRVSLVLADK
jgi:formylglycine-generating enzyme required for sulfatase activity/serine/threonine protein kinase